MTGKDFNLTENRIETIKKLAAQQYSIRYIADKMGIHEDTLGSKMKDAGINYKKLKRDGINTMKADLISIIKEIDDPKDQAKATMDFLKHYDTSDDVASKKQDIKADETVEKAYLPMKDSDN